MTEFKGTKGQWHVSYRERGYNGFQINSMYKVVSDEEEKANATLIEQAPEMLKELIKEVEILKSMGLGDTDRCVRKEKLIIKATKI